MGIGLWYSKGERKIGVSPFITAKGGMDVNVGRRRGVVRRGISKRSLGSFLGRRRGNEGTKLRRNQGSLGRQVRLLSLAKDLLHTSLDTTENARRLGRRREFVGLMTIAASFFSILGFLIIVLFGLCLTFGTTYNERVTPLFVLGAFGTGLRL